jgi:hypothetical protein
VKAYSLVTSLVFGLIVALHAAKLAADGWQIATEPWFIVTTLLAAGLCVWGLVLFARANRR